MLDLEARVHLEEVEAPVGVEEELDRARADVADGARRGAPRLGPWRARSVGVESAGLGRLLDDLLVPPLDAALALEEVHDVAGAVAEDLELDVAAALEQPLEIDRAVAEGGLGDAAPLGERRRQVLGAVHARHPLSAAAGRGLDEERKADPLRLRREAPRRRRAPGASRARRERPPASIAARGRSLPPISSIAAGGGPTQSRPAAVDGPREGRVLREEAVARMDGVGAALPRAASRSRGIER